MDLTKEALQFIQSTAQPYREGIGEIEYSDRMLYPVDNERLAEPLHMSTLTSLCDYILSDADVLPDGCMIIVSDAKKVGLVSPLNEDRKRETFVIAEAETPNIYFNQFVTQEEFLIMLQAQFYQNEGRDLLLKFAGTVEAGSIAEYGDDGVSQKATIKQGVASKATAVVPSPVSLLPMRSFPEVNKDLPASKFVFRMKGDGVVSCALFEADGGAWKSNTMSTIKDFLNDFLDHEGLSSKFSVLA